MRISLSAKPVWDYTKDYEMVVYGKGALFFAQAARRDGARQVRRAVAHVGTRDQQWRVATPAQFQALASELSGKNLDQLFNEWVYPTAVQSQ